MKEMAVLLLVLAVAVAVPVYTKLVLLYRKKHPVMDYDERQKLAQGEACGVAFGTMLMYFLVFLRIYGWQGMTDNTEIPTVQVMWVLALGLLLGVLVFHTDCFLNHAALPLNKKPLRVMAAYFCTGGMELLNYYLRCWWSADGRETVTGHLWLLMGVVSCYLGILYLLEWLRSRKEARDGEE